MEIKLNVVNKREYEESNNYREVVIKLPKSEEELKKDFEYLKLDYDNLSIRDTHVLDCEVIENDDLHFSILISKELSNIIDRASTSGWTTPYQDMKSMYAILKLLDIEQRDKLLAVLEFKREQITNIADAVKYGNNLDYFEFYNHINTPEAYAEKLIRSKELTIDDFLDYIDLETLGIHCSESECLEFTEQGLIYEKNNIPKENDYQEEEEFE